MVEEERLGIHAVWHDHGGKGFPKAVPSDRTGPDRVVGLIAERRP